MYTKYKNSKKTQIRNKKASIPSVEAKKIEIQQFVRRVVYKNKTYKESNNIKIGAIRAQKIKVKVNISVKTQTFRGNRIKNQQDVDNSTI